MIDRYEKKHPLHPCFSEREIDLYKSEAAKEWERKGYTVEVKMDGSGVAFDENGRIAGHF